MNYDKTIDNKILAQITSSDSMIWTGFSGETFRYGKIKRKWST